jgi:hypothetical protein
MRARYYDPSTGRFISKDPIEGMLSNPQSQNGYSYAHDDPINLSDPSGRFIPLALVLALPAVTAYLSVIPPQFLAYETDRIYNSLKDCDYAGAGLEALNLVPMGATIKGESLAAKALNITFKTDHAMRHFEETNLTSEVIEEAIKSDVLSKNIPDIGVWTERTISVQGNNITYRLQQWSEGNLNIGTYFTRK